MFYLSHTVYTNVTLVVVDPFGAVFESTFHLQSFQRLQPTKCVLREFCQFVVAQVSKKTAKWK